MTREEAIKTLKEDGCSYCTWGCESPLTCDNEVCPLPDAIDMAIKALSQEPCDDIVSIRKDALKCRVGNIVAYNVEWLKKHWQMEMDIVCGVKPCDDAISRQAVLDVVCGNYEKDGWGESNFYKAIEQLPSVTQKTDNKYRKEAKRWKNKWLKSQKSGKCKDCKWWKDSDGFYRRGGHAESQCPINRREVLEGNGYCYMFEPQERSE